MTTLNARDGRAIEINRTKNHFSSKESDKASFLD